MSNYTLTYKKNSDDLPCSGYANWGNNRNDRKSIRLYIPNLRLHYIIVTKKTIIVSVSLNAAEYVSLAHVCCEAMWLKTFMEGFNFENFLPLIIHQDNQACIKIASESKESQRIKHHLISFRNIVGSRNVSASIQAAHFKNF